MSRFPQNKGTKGSQKWLQFIVNKCPEILDKDLLKACLSSSANMINWVSPLQGDDFSEYRDQDFLDLLGIELKKRPLKTFWPNRGPQWDALAKSEHGEVFLVEAKSHVTEMLSPGTGASPNSRVIIENSFDETKDYLKVKHSDDWTQSLYQYANRIAHLYLLRELNGIPAFLVFVYFLNDQEMRGPTTKEEWQAAIDLAEGVLGLPQKHKLTPYILKLFIDINQLKAK